MDIEITNCLFHGITPKNILNTNNYIDYKLFSIDVLNNILECGYIKNRISLYNSNIIIGKKPNWNGLNNISLCMHPDNIMIKKKLSNFHRGPEKAFDLFIQNSPSIILNEKLLDELKINKSFFNYKMSDEIQIKENVPLSYLVAIGLPDNTLKLQKRVDILLNHINNNPNDNYTNLISKIKSDIDNNYNYQKLLLENYTVEKIKEMLIKNNYNDLIVEPFSGSIYPSIEKKQLRIKKIINSINKL